MYGLNFTATSPKKGVGQKRGWAKKGGSLVYSAETREKPNAAEEPRNQTDKKSDMSRQGPEPMDVDDSRDIVLYGDYDGAVEGLGVDLPDPNGGALVDVPVKLLAVSGGEAAKGVPEVRVWAIGDESRTKYWERKDTEEQKSKAAAGEWLPQIVANELFARMADEGEETVPVHEFIEEACNDTGDSVLAVEANLFHNEQAALRKALRAKRGLAQASIRRFFRERVRPRSTKKIATTFTQDCITFDEALNISCAAPSRPHRPAPSRPRRPLNPPPAPGLTSSPPR